MSITVLIVDDEPLARERVRMLLEEEKDVTVRAECAGAAEAKVLLLRERIDVMFLDIQMPGMDGLQLVGIIPPERMPLVVFTTAYDEFAVKAFELDAADYLLKPFTKRRFQASLERVRQRLSSGDRDLFISRMLTTVNTIAQRLPYPEKIVVKSDGRICFLHPPEIRWIESEANYLRIHTVQAVHHVRETLTNFSARLDPAQFIRLHRTVIVNTAHLKEMKPWLNDELIAVLKDGTQLPVGRTYRKAVLRSFGL